MSCWRTIRSSNCGNRKLAEILIGDTEDICSNRRQRMFEQEVSRSLTMLFSPAIMGRQRALYLMRRAET